VTPFSIALVTAEAGLAVQPQEISASALRPVFWLAQALLSF
jgi:hypothetical protein